MRGPLWYPSPKQVFGVVFTSTCWPSAHSQSSSLQKYTQLKNSLGTHCSSFKGRTFIKQHWRLLWYVTPFHAGVIGLFCCTSKCRRHFHLTRKVIKKSQAIWAQICLQLKIQFLTTRYILWSFGSFATPPTAALCFQSNNSIGDSELGQNWLEFSYNMTIWQSGMSLNDIWYF